MSDEEVDGASWATEDSLESQLWIQEDSSYFQTSSKETLQALAEAEAVAPAGAGDAATLPPPPPQPPPPPPSSEGTRKAQDPTCCSLHQTDDSRPAQGTTPAEAAERSCPTKRSNETPESFTCDPPCRSPHQTDDSRPAQVTAPPQTTESRCTSRRPNESPESFTRMARPEVSWRPPPTAWPPTAPRCVPWMQPYCYPLHWAPTPVAAAPFPHYPAHVAAPAACGAPGDVCLEQLRALALQNQATLSTLTSMYQALLSETMRLCGLHLAAASSMSHAPFAAPHPLSLGAGAGSYSSLASWPHAYGPCQAVPAQPADSGRSPGPGPSPGPSPGQQALWGARAHAGGSGGVEEKGGQPPPCETSGSAAASDSRQLSRAEGAAPAPPSQDGRDPSSGVGWERARPPTRGLAPEVEKIPSATKASRPVPSPSFHRTRDPLEQTLRQSVALSGGDQRRALKPQPPRATSLDRRFQSASRAHSLFRCDSLHGRCQHSGPGDPPRWPQPPGATAAALRACYLVQQFPPAEEQRSRGCPAPVAPPTPPPPPAPAPAPPKCPPLGASQSATQRDARPKPPPRVSVGVGSSPPRSAVAAAHPRRPPAPAPAPLPLPLPLPPSSLSQPCEARAVAGARGRALASLQRAFRENMAPLGARPTGGAARARANAEAPPQRSAPMADAAQQQMWAEASELGLIMPLSRAAAQGAEEQAAQAAFLLEVLARHPDLVPATDTPGACAQRPPGGARAN